MFYCDSCNGRPVVGRIVSLENRNTGESLITLAEKTVGAV